MLDLNRVLLISGAEAGRQMFMEKRKLKPEKIAAVGGSVVVSQLFIEDWINRLFAGTNMGQDMAWALEMLSEALSIAVGMYGLDYLGIVSSKDVQQGEGKGKRENFTANLMLAGVDVVLASLLEYLLWGDSAMPMTRGTMTRGPMTPPATGQASVTPQQQGVAPFQTNSNSAGAAMSGGQFGPGGGQRGPGGGGPGGGRRGPGGPGGPRTGRY